MTQQRPDDTQRDPSAELGLRNPVRDKAKLGDAQYSVTPPREAVRPAGAHVRCTECDATLDPGQSYRSDGEEYAYHFCDAACHTRWRARRAQADDPRTPKG